MITLAMIAELLMPPARYDHPPKRPVEIVEFEPSFIVAACHFGEKSGMVLACYFAETNRIFIRSDLTPDARAKVLRHEYGHANGWHHD